MKKEALLLIDIQKIYFTPGPLLLHKPKESAKNAARLLERFREENKPVIHVQHNFDILSCIHDLVKPIEGEKVIHKELPSSFLDTDLQEYLQELGVTHLVIAGMMSHMCVDTTVRECQNYGYEVTLISDACTTKSLKFQGKEIAADIVHAVYMASLDDMFAEVMETEKYL